MYTDLISFLPSFHVMSNTAYHIGHSALIIFHWLVKTLTNHHDHLAGPTQTEVYYIQRCYSYNGSAAVAFHIYKGNTLQHTHNKNACVYTSNVY